MVVKKHFSYDIKDTFFLYYLTFMLVLRMKMFYWN